MYSIVFVSHVSQMLIDICVIVFLTHYFSIEIHMLMIICQKMIE